MPIIIRLQNLPWTADSVDIRRYFSGLSIPEGGVHIVGGELGDAFIGFSTDEDARLAMAKDGGKIQESQIKLLLSSHSEMMRVIEKARQQNLVLQAHNQPLPMMTLQQQMVIPAPAVDSDRRRVRSPSPHRRTRDKSPTRDRRRSPDSRRSLSKRERSRSPARGSRGSSRDTDKRHDRYKREDRRYEEPQRYRDDRYSGRTHSQDIKKYPENDGMNRPPIRPQVPGEYRDGTNRGYYDSPAAPNAAYNYEMSRNIASSKDYAPNSYDSHNEKNSLPHPASSNRLNMQPSANQGSYPPYSLMLQAFNGPSYEQSAGQGKEVAANSPANDDFGKRGRRSRFEPDYPDSGIPFFPSSSGEQKPSVVESVRDGMAFSDKRPMNQEYVSHARNVWPQQNDEHSQNSNWAEKRQPLLGPSVPKNRDVMQVVPMDLESSPTATPPDKSLLNKSDQFNSQRNSRPFPANEMVSSRNESISDNKTVFPNEKQWSAPQSMTIEVRGIPSDVRMKEVLDIFRNVPLTPANVSILTNNRGAEKALIRFSKAADFEEAMNGQPRYIRNYRCEIIPCSDAAFEVAAGTNVSKPRNKPKPREEDLCVQLRGLPYSCKETDIANFFDGLAIVDMVVECVDGKCNGIAVVQLATPQDFRTALTMNGKMIGQRYITISVASKEYIAAARGLFHVQNQQPKSPSRGSVNNNFDAPRPTRRPNNVPDSPLDQGPSMHPPNPGRSQSFCICLRGLPEHITNKAIQDFFSEAGIAVKAIHLMLTPEKVPSGEGFIEISTKEEADIALTKHNSMLLGQRISATPIPFHEMNRILNGPPLLPSPGLLKTPGNPDRSRRPLIPQPPSDGPFGEHPAPDHPPSDYPQFDHPPNGRPGPRGDREFFEPPRGERPYPNFPPRGDRPRPDFPCDRPRPDFPMGDRPPFFHPRGDRPRMDGPPMRGMRPPMGRPMRPPFGRMRGPFPPRPRGPLDPRAREQGDIGAPGCVVCIDNLHFNAGFEELLDFFKGYGLMKDNIVRKFHDNDKPTSKARVAFRSPWDAQRVVRELNHKTIMGRSLKLSLL